MDMIIKHFDGNQYNISGFGYFQIIRGAIHISFPINLGSKKMNKIVVEGN